MDPPLTVAGAGVTGAAAGVGLLAIGWASLAAVYAIGRWGLDRGRYARWQSEWIQRQERRENH
ncbi:hypothetical protein [Amycolatopsis samaneae]|uniref:Uncharacterized protein n=1 Tax=Amycolatopsis samaneae TaxID=664691 RepID=A0ABW5GPJ1_9PSEU